MSKTRNQLSQKNPNPQLSDEQKAANKALSQIRMAIAHKILVIVYHLLAAGTCYEETRYDQWNPKQEARERQRALKALERLGYTVTIERAA